MHLALEELEPSGDIRADHRAAVTTMLMAATKGSKLEVQDLMEMLNPWNSPQIDAPRPESLVEKISIFNAGLRGAANRKRGGA